MSLKQLKLKGSCLIKHNILDLILNFQKNYTDYCN